ncbi:MAG: type II toxin-antitoxin system VapB family antitoxin [Candidatus Dormibacteria bacterium]
MPRRIAISLDDDVVDELDAFTRASVLSRSELVNVALRRFLRGERRRAGLAVNGHSQARGIASGRIPSTRLDGRLLLRTGAGPHEN